MQSDKDTDDDYPVLEEIVSCLPEIAFSEQNEALWDELEQRLTERILKRIEERIEFVLRDIISKDLSNSVVKMTDTFVSEVKDDLKNTLDVVVTHAVTEELYRLRRKEFFLDAKQTKITD